MNNVFQILTVAVVIVIACEQKKRATEEGKLKVQLTFEVVPEGGDWYSISWKDTLGMSEGYLPKNLYKRPKEIWCIVTNKNFDTIGHYTGLSSPQTFSYFETKDTIVFLHFKEALNIWSDEFGEDSKEAKVYWGANKSSIEFLPVKFSIKRDLRKQIEVELNEK